MALAFRGIMQNLHQDDSSNSNDDADIEAKSSELSSHPILRATTVQQDLTAHRLRKIYPLTELKDLPTHWDKRNRNDNLIISHGSLRVSYRCDKIPNHSQQQPQTNTQNSAAVKANKFIPSSAGIFYFETTVLKANEGCFGVGLSAGNVNNTRLPGWDPHSYGYHGDDGNFFTGSGTGEKYGPRFNTRDVIGCGLNLYKRTIFFTKNGKRLKDAARGVHQTLNLYPVVGLQVPNESIETNFGQRPFVFDIYNEIRNAMNEVSRKIMDIQITEERSGLLSSIVSSFLQTEGYARTLIAFNKDSNQTMDEKPQSIANRKAICDLIHQRKTGKAIEAMEILYPGILDNNREACIWLRAQRYIEMSLEFARKEKERERQNNESEPCTDDNNEDISDLPSTSRSINPYKRTHSSDSDAPPVRRPPMGHPDDLDQDEPCSSKNGHHKNGRSFREQEEEEMVDEEIEHWEEDELERDEVQVEDDDPSTVQDVLNEGLKLRELAKTSHDWSPETAQFIDKALSTIFLPKKGFRHHEFLSKSHMTKIATIAKRCILNFSCKGFQSKFEHLVENWDHSKANLVAHQVPVARFIDEKNLLFSKKFDTEKLIFVNEDDDENRSSSSSLTEAEDWSDDDDTDSEDLVELDEEYDEDEEELEGEGESQDNNDVIIDSDRPGPSGLSTK